MENTENKEIQETQEIQENQETEVKEISETSETAESGEAAAGKKKKSPLRIFLRVLLVLLFIVIVGAGIFFFGTAYSVKNSDSPVGYWTIKEASSASVTMTEDEATALGLNEIGHFRLDNSGSCEIVYLFDEYEGTWVQNSDSTISISYGDEQTMTVVIDDGGVMSATDGSFMRYTLEK